MSELTEKETQFLFWKDSYIKEFDAKIIDITNEGVILDRTAFYPSGGGQISDQGFIYPSKSKKIKIDIHSIEKEGNRLIHKIPKKMLDLLKVGDSIKGELNWTKRYNLMKAHSSQHILSALIFKLSGVKTNKVAITENHTSIYLEKEITNEILKTAFIEANKTIFAAKNILSTLYEKSSIPKKITENLRGDIEEKDSNIVRIISIENLDYSLCGGTHCKNTSEIGMIMLTDFKGTIIDYTLSEWALEIFTQINLELISISKQLSARFEETTTKISKIINEFSKLKEVNSSLIKLALTQKIEDLKKNPLLLDSCKILASDFSAIEQKYILQFLGKLPENHFAAFIAEGPMLLLISNAKLLPANEIIQILKKKINCEGGGSSKIAQAQLSDPSNIFNIVIEIIKNKLGLS